MIFQIENTRYILPFLLLIIKTSKFNMGIEQVDANLIDEERGGGSPPKHFAISSKWLIADIPNFYFPSN